MRVFITGGTGLIGRRLVQLLLARGDEVRVVTRRYAEARQMLSDKCGLVEGDPSQPGEWMDSAAECDAIINLAGENLFGKRWNAAFKAKLLDSRVLVTQNVVQAITRKPLRDDRQPKALISASAIGVYGPRGDEEVDENTSIAAVPTGDFLTDLCIKWELAARQAEQSGVRCALVRVGVVMDRAGGALDKMVLPFKMFVGGPVGSGRQWMAWIHHDDIVGVFLHALDNPEAQGPLNGTAPNPVTNKQFSTALGHALLRPSFVWTPGFALRLGLGEVASVVLNGQRVIPRRTQALGYPFKYPTIEAALKQIFPAS